jgi:hypothetical protein
VDLLKNRFRPHDAGDRLRNGRIGGERALDRLRESEAFERLRADCRRNQQQEERSREGSPHN